MCWFHQPHKESIYSGLIHTIQSPNAGYIDMHMTGSPKLYGEWKQHIHYLLRDLRLNFKRQKGCSVHTAHTYLQLSATIAASQNELVLKEAFLQDRVSGKKMGSWKKHRRGKNTNTRPQLSWATVALGREMQNIFGENCLVLTLAFHLLLDLQPFI